jgi:hypothetical protein
LSSRLGAIALRGRRLAYAFLTRSYSERVSFPCSNAGSEKSFPEALRRCSGYAAEDAGEVALIGEAALGGNVGGRRPLWIPQQIASGAKLELARSAT